MPKSNANLALKGLDEMFSTEESRQEQKREQVQQIPIEELFPFKEHPFKVLDDEAMQRTVESVAQYGVLAPLIARPRPEGGYEIISGHRRQHAAELAGLETLPVIVREMTDDAAVILMVDSNLQRENILPSERAFAYKMKLEALKKQGARSDLTSGQFVQKSKLSIERVAEGTGEGYKTVQRFIRLTNLIPELLNLVDEKKISFNPAVELSYLDEAQQRDFLQAMDETQNAPSLSQAQRMKKLAQEGKFTYEYMDSNGRVALPDVVDYFIDFYEGRKAHGMIAEKPNSIYQKGGYTKKDVEKNILSNPFKRFEDMRFLMRCKDVETIEVNPIIFRKLTREDWLHIVDVCDKSLEKYYGRFKK